MPDKGKIRRHHRDLRTWVNTIGHASFTVSLSSIVKCWPAAVSCLAAKLILVLLRLFCPWKSSYLVWPGCKRLLFRRDDALFRPGVAISCRSQISPAGQLRLTEEARIGLGLPLTLWFGDCSPADARLHQRVRQRIDFLAHFFRRKGGRWLAEWSVIGTAIGAGVDRSRASVDHLGESVRERDSGGRESQSHATHT
ncbi:hypothetical protein IVB08_37135 [Bradyrhizobium sp. 173]|uniref:hypothetical protein n=1 Tax=Bradyrhizobium sp. 173 TaxID=2782644 RepID=UPI001FF8528A|nr:hypothetical protein [Bradyrhizobium sp. 173]MCK1569469.1 hypothetical protein [Bradyrhizobium sp. 173]